MWAHVCAITGLCGSGYLDLFLVITATNWNGQNQNGHRTKRTQTRKATDRNYHRPKLPQTETITDWNGHKPNGHRPERPQPGSATNWNGHKPKRPQTGMEDHLNVYYVEVENIKETQSWIILLPCFYYFSKIMLFLSHCRSLSSCPASLWPSRSVMTVPKIYIADFEVVSYPFQKNIYSLLGYNIAYLLLCCTTFFHNSQVSLDFAITLIVSSFARNSAIPGKSNVWYLIQLCRSISCNFVWLTRLVMNMAW